MMENKVDLSQLPEQKLVDLFTKEYANLLTPAAQQLKFKDALGLLAFNFSEGVAKLSMADLISILDLFKIVRALSFTPPFYYPWGSLPPYWNQKFEIPFGNPQAQSMGAAFWGQTQANPFFGGQAPVNPFWPFQQTQANPFFGGQAPANPFWPFQQTQANPFFGGQAAPVNPFWPFPQTQANPFTGGQNPMNSFWQSFSNPFFAGQTPNTPPATPPPSNEGDKNAFPFMNPFWNPKV
jgi:hypothetical protein